MKYFVKIQDNTVVDIRKTSEEYFNRRQELYQGQWIEVSEPYPGLGYHWDGTEFICTNSADTDDDQ